MAAQNVENRLAALELEVQRLKNAVEGRGAQSIPWWDKIAGTFANDPVYDEAMRLGREYRQSLRPKPRKRSKSHGDS